MKQIFLWWHKQTFGTFLKTIFFGKFVGKDNFGNKYYHSKKGDRWVVYSSNVEASSIPANWYMWIHKTVNDPPQNNELNHPWEKEHEKNLTGTDKAFKPVKIKKDYVKKYKTWDH